MRLVANSLEDLPSVAKQIVSFAEKEKIWVLNGKMGAGKTTLSKALCQVLGVLDTVNSPTFSIVNEYETQSEETIYHFDFYRIEDPMEALNIGVEEYFDSGNICLIEWASKVEQFLPEQFLLITIEANSEGKREIELSLID